MTSTEEAVRDLSVPRPIDLPTSMSGPTAALDDAKILAAPEDPSLWPAWREELVRWRDSARARHAAGPDRRHDWTARCRSVALVWLWDERLYDRDRGRFTVEAYLHRMHLDYGGVDAVVLWHAYPVIGVDPRNQWDFYDVPGLEDVVGQFQSAGVRVFVDYNPWDSGTRRSGRPDAEDLAATVRALGADGVFLDTLKEGDPALVDALGPGIALEGESRLPLTAVATHALSWAQWFADSAAPGVLRAHWFDRAHMMHHTRRWNRDHSAELASAWVNGCGVLIWDDVFGVWVGWNDRDRATLAAMRRVQGAVHELLVDGQWSPLDGLHPDAIRAGVYGHRYRSGGLTFWALVNRGSSDYTGPVVDDPTPGRRYELTVGVPIEQDVTVPARGVAGVLLVADATPEPAWLAGLLGGPPLVGASDVFPALAVRSVPCESEPVRSVPEGCVVVPAGRYELRTRFRRRETGRRDETTWIDAWKPLPPELHAVVEQTGWVDLGAVAVGRTEVTNAQYAEFLDATAYRPVEDHRFLQHWSGGKPRSGTGQHPVNYVDLRDATAFARWRGMRLPTPEEWQLAVERCGAARAEPLVWNLTGCERTDGVTRYVVLKGGSWFRAQGSDWYVDGGPQDPDWELKLVLPGGGLDRSECVGFRCAVDLEVA